jgi:ferritin-like metal-binding protein YciE
VSTDGPLGIHNTTPLSKATAFRHFGCGYAALCNSDSPNFPEIPDCLDSPNVQVGIKPQKQIQRVERKKRMSALREAFVDELKDLLDAEMQLLKALPKMAKAAQNDGLRAAFQEHQSQTADQIRRLAQVFAAFEEPARGKKCKGMQGLIQEGEEIIKEDEGDAALIAAAQKAEHYEIASYGTLISWAVALGHDDVVEALNQTLEEEKATDKKLTVIAQTVVNSQDSRRDTEEEKPKQPRRHPKRQQSRSRAKSARRTATRGRGTAARARSTKSRGTKAPRSKRLRTAARK